jgi:nucleotidyltransferase substrate binding protein (TIGR01987 family)
MALNLDSLQKSINILKSSLNVVEKHMDSNDHDLTETIRSGVIQNFEVAYEQCWKIIQRWIKENRTPEGTNPRTRKELFRMAAKYGLIEDPLPWFDYGSARNLSSHTYNKDTAISVYETAIMFYKDAEYLFKQIEIMND